VTAYDARLALRATGLLHAFNQAGVLRAADVHVARRLGALGGEDDEKVLLAAALAVRGVRHGSVMLDVEQASAAITPDDADTLGWSGLDPGAEGSPDAAVVPVELPWPDAAEWLQALERSPLVTVQNGPGPAPKLPSPAPDRPLRLWEGAVWLDRYWQMESDVAEDLTRRSATTPESDLGELHRVLVRLWPGDGAHDQRLAAAVCVLAPVAVLAGGPGTGKTTTVAKVLVALGHLEQQARATGGGRPLRIALAAPTGKAAARLQEAVQAAATSTGTTLTPQDRELLAGLTSSTLHRLLGARRGSARFWHHEGNRLPHDVVVVDEASMVPLTMFARLLAALRPQARLILVGDPDQLASVEAGAVLADLVGPPQTVARSRAMSERLAVAVPRDASTPGTPGTSSPGMRDGVALLHTVHRYSSGGRIDLLAQAIRAGEADHVVGLLRGRGDEVQWYEVGDDEPVPADVLQTVRAQVLAVSRELLTAARAGESAAALLALGRHRLLCGHRRGLRGVTHWTSLVQRWVLADDPAVLPRRDGRYPGMPLLVTSNDYDNGLWNGDTGVVVARPGTDELVAAFARGDEVQEVALGRLSDVVGLHAMTVHRSQGSQFASVTLVLPAAASPLATRETLYTGVTRAKERVALIGSEQAVRAAVARPALRATGLAGRLSRPSPVGRAMR